MYILPSIILRRAAICLAAAVFSISVYSCARALTFTDSGQSLAFTNPAGGALADVNGDGRADIIVSSTTKNEVWTGGATGTFTNSGQNLGAGNGSLLARDFDRDGDIDLAFGSAGAGIKFWTNNASGVFSDSGQTLGAGGALRLAAMDVDGDNDLDIIEGRAASPINIWLNNGAGVFTLSSTAINEGTVADLASADFNNDGYLDLVVANQSAINVYYGDGLGGFAAQASSNPSAAQSLCVNDFNGDERNDFAAMSTAGANKAYMTHTTPSQSYMDTGESFGGYASLGCAAADLDNDGYVDLVQAGNTGVDTRFWLNDGSMAFASHTQTLAIGAASPLGVSDVDGDGDADVLLIVTASGAGKVFLSDRANAGGGSVSNAAPSAPSVTAAGTPTTRSPALAWSAAADDYTGSTQMSYNLRVGTLSGKYDVFSGLRGEGPGHVRGSSFTVRDLLDGTYYWSAQAVDSADKKSAWSSEDTFNIAFSYREKAGPAKIAGATQTAQVVAADFDGDGDTDMLVASVESTQRKLYLNNGGGAFTDSGQSISASYARAADVDNDGDLDIAGNNAVWLNNGAGVFTNSGQSLNAGRLCVADADGDGDMDIIAGMTDRLYINNGAGSFSPSGQSAFSVDGMAKCGDFDLDGDVDAAVYSSTEQTLRIWANNGTGWFGTTASQSVYISTTVWKDYTLADIDGDGDMDVVPTSGNILTNNGGVFTEGAVSLNTGFSVSDVACDADNDGDTDVFVSSLPDSASILWKNSGAGAFTPLSEVYSIKKYYASGLAIADVNGDGYDDIFTTGGMVYLNDMYNGPGGNAPVNTAPAQPALTHHADSATSTVTLTWAQSTDAQTAGALITYNARIGTSPGQGNIYSGAAPVGPGKDGSAESLTIRHLPNTTIYWAVQAVDAGFATSAWPANDSFAVNVPFAMSDSGQSLGSANTNAACAADFDGDGDPDFAEGNNGASEIWTNNGAGTFAAGGALGSAVTQAIACADVNGDGFVDVVLGNAAANGVMLNNGSGAFTPKSETFASDDTRAVAAADFDRNGSVDLFFGNAGADTVWLNNGSAVFTQTAQSLGGAVTNAAVAADFDRDGDIDVITGEAVLNHLWLNDGAGSFTDSGQTPGTGITLSAAASDADRDGDMDFIQGTSSGTKIWLNNGSGTFTDSGQTLASGDTTGATVADFDHDGDADIFTAASGSFSKIWLNNGNGTFTDLGGNYGGGSVTAVAVADVDGDRDVDAILAYTGGANRVFLNNMADAAGGNSPNYAPSAPSITPAGSPSLTAVMLSWYAAVDNATPMNQLTYNLRVGRTSGSGDLFSGAIGIGPGNAGAALTRTISQLYPGRYYWSAQAVDGDYAKSAWSAEDTFNNIVPFTDSGLVFASAKTRGAVAADFNSDGFTDVVAGNDGATKLWINNGGLNFTDSGLSLGGDATISAFAADFNGDGNIDLVKGEYDGSAHTYINGGGGALAGAQTLLMPGLNVFNVTGGDVDLDGDIDLVFATFNGPNKIWLNNGAGAFTASANDILSSSSYYMYPSDVDRDGAVDFVDSTTTGVKVWHNQKDGSFISYGTTLGGINARVAVAADFNGDGKPDIARNYGARIEVFFGDGQGGFTDSGQIINATGSINMLYPIDVDIDGDMDIVAGTSQGVMLFLNDGAGAMSDSKQLLGPYDTRALAVADFDGDTDPDIFAGNYNQASKYWKNLRVSSGSPIAAGTAPTAPAPQNLDTFKAGKVTLRWSAGSDATTPAGLLRYNVRVSKSPASGDTMPGIFQEDFFTTGATSAYIVTLGAGTYYWSARTVDTGQMKSAWSADDSFIVTPPDTAPPVFAGIGSVSDTALGGTVALQWSAATDETEPITYKVFVRTATGSFNYNSPATTVSTLGATVTGLTNYKGYSFAVRARDGIGNVDANTVERSATPTYSGDIVPKAPTGLASLLNGSAVTITWATPTQNTDGSALADLAGYNVYRAASCNSAVAVKLNISAATAPAYLDTGLAADSIYYYFVRAVNSKQAEGPVSTCLAVTTYTKGVQGYVKRVDPSGGTVAGTGYPTLPVQGMTVKLFDGVVEAASATTDAAGYFFLSVSGDTAGKTYTMKLVVTVASGYLGDDGSFSGGVGYSTVAKDIIIGSSVVTQTVRDLGVGPSVGDANCDWVANMKDFTVLKKAFNKVKGDTGYTRNADFNGDETANMKDFTILKKNFNQIGNPVNPPPCY